MVHEFQVFIFTNPSARAGYDTRSIFKRSFRVFLLLDQLPHQVLQSNTNDWIVIISLRTVKWLNNSTSPTDGSLAGTNIPSRVDLGVMTRKGYASFPKAPRLKPHHQMVLCYPRHLLGERVLSLCRDEVGVFCGWLVCIWHQIFISNISNFKKDLFPT